MIICSEAITALEGLEAASVDIILVDTPFGTTRNAWDSLLNLGAMWEQSRRVIKKHGAIVHFGVYPYTSALIATHPKGRRGFKHNWIWDKGQHGNFAVAKYMPLTHDEHVLVFTGSGERVNYYPILRKGPRRRKGGAKAGANNGAGFGGMKAITYWSEDYQPTNILRFAGVPRGQRLHASQKPVALLEYLISTYSRPGETVLDFTCGSGSTAIAAINTGRNYIVIDKDPHWIAVTEQRINAHQGIRSG